VDGAAVGQHHVRLPPLRIVKRIRVLVHGVSLSDHPGRGHAAGRRPDGSP
jgi:hypothetical protein